MYVNNSIVSFVLSAICYMVQYDEEVKDFLGVNSLYF